MPPRKDPNAHNTNAADKNTNGSSGANVSNTTSNSNATSTTITTSATTTTPITAAVQNTTTVTTNATSVSPTTAAAAATVTIPANITNTRSAAAAAAAAFTPSADGNNSSNETLSKSLSAADAAAEQRTMAFQANAKLCRLVRKCPWMYDRNHHNYAKKHILDKSWVKIARECNDSVPSCKERWRNIRAAFARSINIYKTHSGPNRVKPYYLHKELSFLVKPMMEGRDKNDEVQDTSECAQKDDFTEGEEEDEENDIADEPQPAEDEEEFTDETSELKSAFEALNPEMGSQSEAKYHKMLKNLNNVILNSTNRNRNLSTDFEGSSSANLFEPNNDFSASDAENEFQYAEDTMSQMDLDRKSVNMFNHNPGLKRPPVHLEQEQYEPKRLKLTPMTPSPAEADIRFLEALLPDMALMNTRQKIVFKRKIYQTLEEVFENFSDFPNINSQSELQQQNMSQQTMISSSAAASMQPSTPSSHMVNMNNLGPNQVKQTILTVNSPTARNLINNIANLSETDLQRINGFLQTNMRSPGLPNNGNNNNGNPTHMNNHTNQSNINNQLNQNPNASRLTNGGAAPTPPSSTAVRLMHSTPKITITKVTCPPPASLRNIGMAKPPSPSTATVSTTIHHTPGQPIMTSNVHSTTSSTTGNTTIPANISNNNNASNSSVNSPWNQLMPIAIKDEVEDVDID